ncbi:MAG: Tim44 domain-containing protein [Marinicaulis sp.]|nr:Tim44/TimA family putative adaptor protein [Marinicaulis sp.]NNE41197.1 Tim44 domain-containing protein [Marinicaulis sp.]NNL88375.1 Tim44 domain-containing protein [Marinicaulis sp.]
MDPVLLILAVITAFILFRLFSVMGTRTGHEHSHDIEAPERQSSRDQPYQNNDASEADAPPAPTPVSTNARKLRDADPEFDEGMYLEGARGAYEMIVEAFTSGDLRSIRQYISDDVYEAFKQAVIARDDAGHTSELKFVGIEHAAIVNSEVDDTTMSATTEFSSNQVRVTRNADGEVVEGDPNRIDLVKDRWVFSRKRGSRDPNWILTATSGGE